MTDNSVNIYHGTSHYFEAIDLGQASRIEGRQAMDQLGQGFYTAINPNDSAKAGDYAATYAGHNGMLLSAKVNLDSVGMLNMGEAIGDDVASQMQAQFKDMAGMNGMSPGLSSYLNHLSENITPDMSGQRMWNMVSMNGAFDSFLRNNAYKAIPESSEIGKLMRHANTEIFNDDLSLADVESLDDAGKMQLKERLESFVEKGGPLSAHYQALLDGPKKMLSPSQYMEARFVGPNLKSAIDVSLSEILDHDIVMDSLATEALNKSGIDALHIPEQDTLVWKGNGVNKLPEFSLERVIGSGVKGAPDFNPGEKVINQGSDFVELAINSAKDADPGMLKGAAGALSGIKGGVVTNAVIGSLVGTFMLAGGAGPAEAAAATYEAAVPYGETQFDLADGDTEAAARSATIETGANVGALGGAIAGAAIGTAILPVVGTAVGSVVGGVVGGIASGEATELIYDNADEISDWWNGEEAELLERLPTEVSDDMSPQLAHLVEIKGALMDATEIRESLGSGRTHDAGLNESRREAGERIVDIEEAFDQAYEAYEDSGELETAIASLDGYEKLQESHAVAQSNAPEEGSINYSAPANG